MTDAREPGHPAADASTNLWFRLAEPADPAHVAAVLAGLADTQPRCGLVRVIAVDGPSGSGKTTLAKGVSDVLKAPVVHMDDLFPGWDGLEAAVGLLVDQVLAPLARSEPATYRVWDWTRSAWGGSRTVPPTDLLIIEGCASSVGPAGTYAALRVWVEAPQASRLRRGLDRDGEDFRPHWQRWAAQESRMYAADGTRAKADLVIATA